MKKIILRWYLFWAAFFRFVGYIHTCIWCQIRAVKLYKEIIAELEEEIACNKEIIMGLRAK